MNGRPLFQPRLGRPGRAMAGSASAEARAFERALEASGLIHRRTVDGSWRIELRIRGVRATARILDDWAFVRAQIPARLVRATLRRDDPLRSLACNAGLPGLAKLVLDPSTPSFLEMRAELPLTEAGADAEKHRGRWLRETRDGFALATQRLRRGPDLPGAADTASGPPGPAPDLPSLCSEAGWAANPTGDGAARVELDAGHAGFHQALLHSAPSGLRLHTDVRTELPETISPAGWQAVALFLLRTGATLRFARPFIDPMPGTLPSRSTGTGQPLPPDSTGDEVRLGFETFLPSPVHAADLHHALSALSLAARLSAGEAEALATDPGLALAFRALAMVRPASPAADRRTGPPAPTRTPPPVSRPPPAGTGPVSSGL